MTITHDTTAPPWLDDLNRITNPGGPFPSAWRWLLAAHHSSPAALRAALATYAILLGEEGLSQAEAKALEIRRAIDLAAPDPKAERLALLLADGRPTLVVTEYAATVLYLRGRLAMHLPAWCTRCLAGWREILLPRERILDWFRGGAPDVAPWVLIAREPICHEELGRLGRVVRYDRPTASP
jgi:hypothetical protein